MENKIISVLWFLILVCNPGSGFGDKEENKKAARLEKLKIELKNTRDSLQDEIAGRWREKQRHIQKREENKNYIEQLRESQQQKYSTLSRIKEECFTLSRRIENEKEETSQQEDFWKYVHGHTDELLSSEAEKVISFFPLDRENQRYSLENVRQKFQEKRNTLASFKNLVKLKCGNLKQTSRLSLTRNTVLPSGGEAVELTVARFGMVFGYGVSDKKELYAIRQTGRLDEDRFTIDSIGNPGLKAHLLKLFPEWIESDSVYGEVLTDVLQSSKSESMITGEKKSFFTGLRDYIISGGPVMAALFLLPLWSLVLIIKKILQFGKAGSGKYCRKLFEKLEQGDVEKVKKSVEGEKYLAAKAVKTCIDNSENDRETAVRAVNKLTSKELPELGSHLNTLAVIAGIAPLLGLLGTVTGMIELFTVITSYGTGDPKIMAGGISEALITTQAGLIIAVPVLLVHNYLRNRKEKIRTDMELCTVTAMNMLWPKESRN